ncbi:hypothetical protein NHX12_010141, partial [Muraenolepis orangiensis]
QQSYTETDLPGSSAGSVCCAEAALSFRGMAPPYWTTPGAGIPWRWRYDPPWGRKDTPTKGSLALGHADQGKPGTWPRPPREAWHLDTPTKGSLALGHAHQGKPGTWTRPPSVD